MVSCVCWTNDPFNSCRGVVIGLSVAGGFILLVGILVAAFLLMRRRRRRIQRQQSTSIILQSTVAEVSRDKDPANQLRGRENTPTPPLTPGKYYTESELIQNPAYATQPYSPSVSSVFAITSIDGSNRESTRSGGSFSLRPPNRHHASIGSALSRAAESTNDSVNPNDIESMLIAASHSPSSDKPPLEQSEQHTHTRSFSEHRQQRGISGESHRPKSISVDSSNENAGPSHGIRTSIVSDNSAFYEDLFTRRSAAPTPVLQAHYRTPSMSAVATMGDSRRSSGENVYEARAI